MYIYLVVLQIRLESIDSINKILEEANKRIQPTGTGKASNCTLFPWQYIWNVAAQYNDFDQNLGVELSGELFGALRGRLYDSNKNLVMATLAVIGGIASAMGPPVEKSSKVCLLAFEDHFILFMSVCLQLLIGVLSTGNSVRCFEMPQRQ